MVDIGSSSVRAGYAGDDTPKAIIPTSYGFKLENPDGDATMTDDGEEGEEKRKRAKLFLGQHGPSIWRDQMEIGNPVRDGLSVSFFLLFSVPIFTIVRLVNDFEPIAPLISHALVDVMRCSATEHPVLITEPAWNTPTNRERMAEIMFEEFQVPAFYIANTGVLNA